MINIVKKEIDVEESLRKRLEIVDQNLKDYYRILKIRNVILL